MEIASLPNKPYTCQRPAARRTSNNLSEQVIVLLPHYFNSSVLLHQFTTTVEAQTASTMWLLLAINSLAREEFQFSFEVER